MVDRQILSTYLLSLIHTCICPESNVRCYKAAGAGSSACFGAHVNQQQHRRHPASWSSPSSLRSATIVWLSGHVFFSLWVKTLLFIPVFVSCRGDTTAHFKLSMRPQEGARYVHSGRFIDLDLYSIDLCSFCEDTYWDVCLLSSY